MHSISTITVISIARVAFSGMGQARIENYSFYFIFIYNHAYNQVSTEKVAKY